MCAAWETTMAGATPLRIGMLFCMDSFEAYKQTGAFSEYTDRGILYSFTTTGRTLQSGKYVTIHDCNADTQVLSTT